MKMIYESPTETKCIYCISLLNGLILLELNYGYHFDKNKIVQMINSNIINNILYVDIILRKPKGKLLYSFRDIEDFKMKYPEYFI